MTTNYAYAEFPSVTKGAIGLGAPLSQIEAAPENRRSAGQTCSAEPWHPAQVSETQRQAQRRATMSQTIGMLTPTSKHLAIFIYGLSGGGATRRTLTLAEGFVRRGHRVDLVTVSSAGPLVAQVPHGVRLMVLNSPLVRLAGWLRWRRRRNQILGSIPALARYLRRECPDVLMSAANHVHLSALWARRLSGAPVPLVLRTSNHLTQSHLGGPKRRRPLRLRLARRWYGWADAAIAVSRGIAEDLVTHTALPAGSVHTIYNPTYTPESLEKAKAPNDHPWLAPGEAPVILGAGRLTPQKDFATLVRAFARVRAQRTAHLVILGDGKRRREILDLAQRLGVSADLELPGYVENPFSWMSRAAVFVLSSVWEGFPGVLIEAMTCGCPVVSTDCPSGPAEILDGGSYGRLVPTGDDEALAEAILASLQEPDSPERLRSRAAEFSVDRAVDRYLAVLLGTGAAQAGFRSC